MGWFGNSLAEVGRSFLDLRWVTAPRLVFGVMCGVGKKVVPEVFTIACLRDAFMANYL
jgi:hypothetical protein